MYKIFLKIKKLMTTRSDWIVCPCGYKTTSERRAIAHLQKHPVTPGSIDAAGQVIWQ